MTFTGKWISPSWARTFEELLARCVESFIKLMENYVFTHDRAPACQQLPASSWGCSGLVHQIDKGKNVFVIAVILVGLLLGADLSTTSLLR